MIILAIPWVPLAIADWVMFFTYWHHAGTVHYIHHATVSLVCFALATFFILCERR